MPVYFIQEGNQGPIKIGATKRKIPQRQTNLQVGNPRELRILGSSRGYKKREKEIQSILYMYKIRGEWFDYCEEVYQHIEEVVIPFDPSSENKELLGLRKQVLQAQLAYYQNQTLREQNTRRVERQRRQDEYLEEKKKEIPEDLTWDYNTNNQENNLMAFLLGLSGQHFRTRTSGKWGVRYFDYYPKKGDVITPRGLAVAKLIQERDRSTTIGKWFDQHKGVSFKAFNKHEEWSPPDVYVECDLEVAAKLGRWLEEKHTGYYFHPSNGIKEKNLWYFNFIDYKFQPDPPQRIMLRGLQKAVGEFMWAEMEKAA